MSSDPPRVLVTIGDAWHILGTSRNVWVADVFTRNGVEWISVWPEQSPVGERMKWPVSDFLRLCARGYVAR